MFMVTFLTSHLLWQHSSSTKITVCTFVYFSSQARKTCKNIFKKLYVILAYDEEAQKVFPNVPIIGFKNSKSLRLNLARAVLPDIDEVGSSKPYGGEIPLSVV